MSIHLDERPDGGLALFIDGDLQFDSRDEALYHENMALPALSLARAARDDALRVLICGGGDGLALRECLRFPGVTAVDLVDLSAEVVELGRTGLAKLNGHAFSDPRVTVTIADAWEFLAAATPYDVILCDLTVPRRPEDTRVFTVEWYERVREALARGGVATINGLSPTQSPEAFWCLRRTIRAAGLFATGYRVCLPSFRDAGYGVWSFFLAGHQPLTRQRLSRLECPVATRQADLTQLGHAARFRREERALEAHVPAHRLAQPCLLPLLLNPGRTDLAQVADDAEPYGLDRLLELLPILHPYHSREMVEVLAAEVVGTVQGLDLPRLVDALLARAAALPGALVQELRRLRDWLVDGVATISSFSAWCYRLFAILILILTVANILAPDNAFGKGPSGLGHASMSRGVSSFGGHPGSLAGSRVGGSFGRSATAAGPARTGSSFAGQPGTRSFGRSGSFESSAAVRSTHITSRGFRQSYRNGRMTDIYGNDYPLRTFYYSPWHSHVYYGGQAPAGGDQQPQPQKALFAADDDVLVMDNGDVVLTLSDVAYLVASEGRLSLLSSKLGAPLVDLYPEPNLFDNVANTLGEQRAVAWRELNARRDWLAWVGWTSALFPVIREDQQETANLVDLSQRLEKAVTRLGQPAPLENLPPVAAGGVELFAGAFAFPDGQVYLRQPGGTWLKTDGKKIWTTDPAAGKPCPPELQAALRSVITKLRRELAGDVKALENDLKQLDQDRSSLQQDLSQYESIAATNPSDYEVDYGTQSIAVSDALTRTRTDLQQNDADRSETALGWRQKAQDDDKLARAADRFGQ